MSAQKQKTKIIPAQRKGVKSDTSYAVIFGTQAEAVDFFKVASKRLLKVSEWHVLCGVMSATFALVDSSGKKVSRYAREGDFLRIDVPGPGSQAGDGYDWVRIERTKNKHFSTKDYEELALHVKPAKNPKDKTGSTAHFFKGKASSTFILSRDQLAVKMEIHGRNEVPNIKVENPLDVLRNAFMALGAMLGFSKMQWKKLAKGILSDPGIKL